MKTPEVSTPVGGDPDGLASGSVTVVGAVMTSVATMSPAINVAFTVPFLAATSGYVSPLAVLLAGVIAYLLGFSLAQIARRLRSAGSYSSFTARVLGPGWGFMVSWMYLLFFPVATAMLCGLMGSTVHDVLLSEHQWNVAWWVPALVTLIAIGAFSYRGVSISVEVMLLLGVAEMGIMLVLAVWGLARPGAGGTSLSWLWFAHRPSVHQFFLGFVFGIYAFSGWDAAATLGEETASPLRNIPRAVLGSIGVMAVFLVVTTWGQLAGWGSDSIGTFGTAGEAPVFTLAHKFWGPVWFLALIAVINSIAASALSCMTASVRLIYDMSRRGNLPRQLSRLTKRRTPGAAVVVQTVVNIVIELVLAGTVGLENAYSFTGLVFIFSSALVYLVGNVVVFRLYSTQAQAEFSVLKHVVIPIAGSAALIYVVYMSLVPTPASPYDWAMPVVIMWLFLGAVALAVRAVVRARRSSPLHPSSHLEIATEPEGA